MSDLSEDGDAQVAITIASTHMKQMIGEAEQQEIVNSACEDEALAPPETGSQPLREEALLMSFKHPASSTDACCMAKDSEGHGKKLQYVLRINPKRSRRFLDPDYNILPLPPPASTTISSSISTRETPAPIPAPATISIKKPTSTCSEKARACTECGKEFQSWKALFGHMRCHPERQWRGIQPPTSSSCFSPIFKSSPASKRKASHSQPQLVSAIDKCGKAQCTDNLDESDTESIEAAYMHERDEKTSPKAEKGSQVHLQEGGVRCTSPNSESEVIMDEQDMADCLVMLAFAAKEEPVSSHFRDNNKQGKNIHSIVPAIYAEPKRVVKKKKHLEKANHVLEAEEKVVEFDDDGTGHSYKSRFQCTSCKKTFKSHQALGGHRASHKKVKGCFARTQPPDDMSARRALQEIDMPLNERNVAEDAHLDPPVTKGEQEDPREEQTKRHMGQFLQFSMSCHEKMDDDMHDSAITVDKKQQLRHQSSSSSSSSSVIAGMAVTLLAHPHQQPKVHICTVCHRVFSTGQALGGHKRCHWASSPASNSSQKGTPSQDSDSGCCEENPQLSLQISASDKTAGQMSKRDACTFNVDQAQINELSAAAENSMVQRPYFHHVDDVRDVQSWPKRGYAIGEEAGELDTAGHDDGRYNGEDGSLESSAKVSTEAWQQKNFGRNLAPKEELILDLNLPAPEKEAEDCASALNRASFQPPWPCFQQLPL